MLELSLSIADLVVFGAVVFISMLIGVYHAVRGNRNNEEYLMGGHSIGVLPMAISLCASFNSAYMILGIPAEIYSYGLQFYIMLFGTGLGVLLAGELWIPVLYRLKIVSMYEYFELRYSSKLLRLIMTVIFILKTIMYLGVVLYAPTVALAAVTNISWQTSILVLGICSTIYTSIGGMKAVVWTDVFQIFIVFGGILAIFVQGIVKLGGFEDFWAHASDGGRTELFNFSLDPFERHTTPNVFFGTLIMWGSPYVCSQYLVQRCCCMPTFSKARLALYLNYIGQFVMTTLVAGIGLIMYVYYSSCDPVKASVVSKRDALIPIFVLQEFAALPGVAGLFISCLFSGALSTLDSALNSLAAVTWEEVKGINCFKTVSSKLETNITKALSVTYGFIAIGIAFICHDMGSLINVGSRLFGACMGPMYALCLVSVCCPMVNSTGAVLGLIIGQIVNMWLSFGAMIYASDRSPLPLNTTDCSMFNISTLKTLPNNSMEMMPNRENDDDDSHWIYLMSYNIYPIIGFVITALFTLMISVIFRRKDKTTKEDSKKYIHPMAWNLFHSLNKIEEEENLKPNEETDKIRNSENLSL